MADQVFCAAVGGGTADHESWKRVQNAVDELARQMNNHSDFNSYYSYGPFDHEWNIYALEKDGKCEQLREYAYRIAEAEKNGEISTSGGDRWIIVDGLQLKGYGDDGGVFSVELSSGQSPIHVGRSINIAGLRNQGEWIVGDPDEVTDTFVMHEMGHLLDANHWHGDRGKDKEGVLGNVTPMASAYTYSAGAEVDTCIEGSGFIPDNFCIHKNHEGEQWCDNCTDPDFCRHTLTMTNCTKDEIDKCVSNSCVENC